MTDISPSFTHKMVAKINWHRYGTKLHHGHPMYMDHAVLRYDTVQDAILTRAQKPT